MSAPKRWLDDASASSAERELLQSGLGLDPPPSAQGEVWAALLAKIPPPGAPPPTQAGGGAGAGKAAASSAKAAAGAGKGAVALKTAAGAGVLKSALIGAGSAALLITTYSVVTPSSDPAPHAPSATVITPPATAITPRDPAPPRAVTEPSAAPSAAPSAEPSVEKRPAVEQRPAAPAQTASADPTERETMLREESRLVAEARDALRRGDAAGALGMLDQIRARFPAGVLAQEREALSIEALARSGQKGEASARARRFVERYPTSPLTARVQGFAQ